MERKEYNGWTNYETWNVSLWIDNDQSLSDYFTSEAQDIYDNSEADKTFTREENASYQLSDFIKEYFEEQNPLKENADVFADLLNAALSEVNWQEIAENIIKENVDKTDVED